MQFFAGLGVGLSLIVAIGAQNAFVLRQGIRRQHVFAVAFICAVSDALLITLGVLGVGLALHTVPWLIMLVRWLGVAFLLTYAFLALKRAWKGGATGLEATPDVRDSSPGGVATLTRTTSTLAATVGATLAITWLNPHVYLDTVFLLGSVAATHGATRWWFAAGAMAASFAWFFALALGSRHLGRWLSTPRAWRILDAVIAVVMLALAVSLVWPR